MLSSHSLAHNLPGPKAHILVNHSGQACLTDFRPLAIAAEKEYMSSAEGTSRWMGPEFLNPATGPARESDCYSLGMVIYEVLSGQVPSGSDRDFNFILNIMSGECPEKPEGARGVWFTAEIWAMLELCWKLRPADWPDSRDILRVLERAQPPSGSPAPGTLPHSPQTLKLTSNCPCRATPRQTSGGTTPR